MIVPAFQEINLITRLLTTGILTEFNLLQFDWAGPESAAIAINKK